jgi:hypothetical protein
LAVRGDGRCTYARTGVRTPCRLVTLYRDDNDIHQDAYARYTWTRTPGTPGRVRPVHPDVYAWTRCTYVRTGVRIHRTMTEPLPSRPNPKSLVAVVALADYLVHGHCPKSSDTSICKFDARGQRGKMQHYHCKFEGCTHSTNNVQRIESHYREHGRQAARGTAPLFVFSFVRRELVLFCALTDSNAVRTLIHGPLARSNARKRPAVTLLYLSAGVRLSKLNLFVLMIPAIRVGRKYHGHSRGFHLVNHRRPHCCW